MLGTIVNALAIAVGGFIGFLVKGGLPEKMSQTIMQGVGLCVALIGLSGALEGTEHIMPIIFFIVIGTLIGEGVDIEKRLETLGNRLEAKFSKDHNRHLVRDSSRPVCFTAWVRWRLWVRLKVD